MTWVFTVLVWARIARRRIKYGNTGMLRRDGYITVAVVLISSFSTAIQLLNRDTPVDLIGKLNLALASIAMLYYGLWNLCLFFIKYRQDSESLIAKIDLYFE